MCERGRSVRYNETRPIDPVHLEPPVGAEFMRRCRMVYQALCHEVTPEEVASAQAALHESIAIKVRSIEALPDANYLTLLHRFVDPDEEVGEVELVGKGNSGVYNTTIYNARRSVSRGEFSVEDWREFGGCDGWYASFRDGDDRWRRAEVPQEVMDLITAMDAAPCDYTYIPADGRIGIYHGWRAGSDTDSIALSVPSASCAHLRFKTTYFPTQRESRQPGLQCFVKYHTALRMCSDIVFSRNGLDLYSSAFNMADFGGVSQAANIRSVREGGWQATICQVVGGFPMMSGGPPCTARIGMLRRTERRSRGTNHLPLITCQSIPVGVTADVVSAGCFGSKVTVVADLTARFLVARGAEYAMIAAGQCLRRDSIPFCCSAGATGVVPLAYGSILDIQLADDITVALMPESCNRAAGYHGYILAEYTGRGPQALLGFLELQRCGTVGAALINTVEEVHGAWSSFR
jgi:hypothetical protein